MTIRLSASLACADPLQVGEVARRLDEAAIDALHFDLCDGHFAPTFLLAPALLRALRPLTGCRFDVHLYCTHPSRYLDELRAAGADVIIVHWEAAEDAAAAVGRIRQAGMRAGVALLPTTAPPPALAGLLPELALVVTNMVGPAYAGQPFDVRGLENARRVAAMARTASASGSGSGSASASASIEIVADGSVSAQRLASMVEAGCTHLVLGTSSLFRPGALPAEMAATLANVRTQVAALEAARATT